MNTKKTIKLALDGVFLAGAAVFVYGLSLAWRPLGFIVGGLLAAVISFLIGYGQSDFRSKP